MNFEHECPWILQHVSTLVLIVQITYHFVHVKIMHGLQMTAGDHAEDAARVNVFRNT